MKKRKNASLKTSCLQLALMAGCLGGALTAAAQHTAISTLLPGGYHSEEALTWCGDATGQMVVAGYPSSACTVAQADMDTAIQAAKVETNWDTDPAGLRSAISSMCPGGHWVVFSQTDATVLMWSAAYWMTRNQYPVAALLGTTPHNTYTPHQEHWVTVTAIVTDQDPTTHSTVNLEFVQFVDPSPLNLGDPPLVRFVTGAQWYADFAAVTKTSAYNGKFVALIEPPQTLGRAPSVLKLLETGRVIPPGEAERAAVASILKLKLAELQGFREFAEVKPLKPILVNPARGGYYLVPFSKDEKTASLAVIVNAYNGDFEEAGHFAPHAFLSEAAAVESARAALGLKTLRPGQVKAELVSSETESRYAPEWRITEGNRSFTVGQRGNVREPGLKIAPR